MGVQRGYSLLSPTSKQIGAVRALARRPFVLLCPAIDGATECNQSNAVTDPRVNLGIHTIHTIHLLTARPSSKPLALVHLPASHIHSLSGPRPEARVLCSTLTERAAKNRRLSLVRLGLAWPGSDSHEATTIATISTINDNHRKSPQPGGTEHPGQPGQGR